MKVGRLSGDDSDTIGGGVGLVRVLARDAVESAARSTRLHVLAISHRDESNPTGIERDGLRPKESPDEGIDVDGDPAMTLSFGIRPGSASNIRDIRRVMDLGMIATACPAVNAVPAVCRAAPGILGYADLPIHAARFSG